MLLLKSSSIEIVPIFDVDQTRHLNWLKQAAAMPGSGSGRRRSEQCANLLIGQGLKTIEGVRMHPRHGEEFLPDGPWKGGRVRKSWPKRKIPLSTLHDLAAGHDTRV